MKMMGKRCLNLSLKYKVIIPLLALLISSSVVTALIVSKKFSSYNREHAKRELVFFKEKLRSEVIGATTASMMLATNMAANTDIQFGIALKDALVLKQLASPLLRSLQGGEFLSGYFDFTDADGMVIYASSHPELVGKKLIDRRPLLKKAKEIKEMLMDA